MFPHPHTLFPSQVRLNLLSTLLDEAYGFLHRFMCASVLGRKVFTLPFSRDVDITVEGARAMRACLQYCQQVSDSGGGVAMRACLQYCQQVRGSGGGVGHEGLPAVLPTGE